MAHSEPGISEERLVATAVRKKCSHLILAKPVCEPCMLRFPRAPKTCPGCREVKVLAFYDSADDPLVPPARGKPVYGCATCGREDSHFGRRCAPCVLRTRHALLADASGEVHPSSTGLRGAHGRPTAQSALYWLTRSEGPGTCGRWPKARSRSRMQPSTLPSNRAVIYVHELLAASGCSRLSTPASSRSRRGSKDSSPLPKDQAEIIGRFAKWQVLRRLADQGHSGCSHRAASKAAGRDRHSGQVLSPGSAPAETIETARPGRPRALSRRLSRRGEVLVRFVKWANRIKLSSGLELSSLGVVTARRALRRRPWRQVELLLHDESLRLNVRRRPFHAVVRSAADADLQDERAIGRLRRWSVTVDFGRFPIELPGPLDQLVVEQLARG